MKFSKHVQHLCQHCLPHLMRFKTAHGINDTVQVQVMGLFLPLPGSGPGPGSGSRPSARLGHGHGGLLVLGVPVQLDAQVYVGDVQWQWVFVLASLLSPHCCCPLHLPFHHMTWSLHRHCGWEWSVCLNGSLKVSAQHFPWHGIQEQILNQLHSKNYSNKLNKTDTQEHDALQLCWKSNPIMMTCFF